MISSIQMNERPISGNGQESVNHRFWVFAVTELPGRSRPKADIYLPSMGQLHSSDRNACVSLTRSEDGRLMINCDELIDELHQLTRQQLRLAVMATVDTVAAMHLDLALFGSEQARFAEEVCDDT